MKHKVLTLIAALTMMLCIVAAMNAHSSADSQRVHDGETFTISASTFLEDYQDALDYSKCSYKFSFHEAFSDSNAQYYDLLDEHDDYEMTLVLYTNYDTKKLETVRFYCEADSLLDLALGRRLQGMLVAYVVANSEMTGEKLNQMFTEQEHSSYYDEVYCGEFDGVSYQMTISDGTVEFHIE